MRNLEEEIKYQFRIVNELNQIKKSFEKIDEEWYSYKSKVNKYVITSPDGESIRFSNESYTRSGEWYFFTESTLDKMIETITYSFKDNNKTLSILYHEKFIEEGIKTKGSPVQLIKWRGSISSDELMKLLGIDKD